MVLLLSRSSGYLSASHSPQYARARTHAFTSSPGSNGALEPEAVRSLTRTDLTRHPLVLASVLWLSFRITPGIKSQDFCLKLEFGALRREDV